MSDPVLKASTLRKTYLSGDRRIEVLSDVGLDVEAGESVSIRGESGSGKSTLLNLLAALDTPDSGEILWAGKPSVGTKVRATFLGMVFQSFYLIPELDALQNVLMARRMVGRTGSSDKMRAKELLAKVGLAERAHHLPSQLSGGERQRVAVARALMNSPQLILADEPTGNLDSKNGDALIRLLHYMNKNFQRTVVLVTHNIEYLSIADQILLIEDGVVREMKNTAVQNITSNILADTKKRIEEWSKL